MRVDDHRYPIEPLARAMRVPVEQVATALGISGTTWRIIREHGARDHTADRMAIRAGFHPFLIWPDMLDNRLAYDQRQLDIARRKNRAARARDRHHQHDDQQRTA